MIPDLTSLIALLCLLGVVALPLLTAAVGKPRLEHPRPDWNRGTRDGLDWLNLNGAWQFEFDDDDVGETEEWFRGRALAEEILVPFCWESLMAWGEQDRADNDTWFSARAYLRPEEVTRDNYREAERHEIGWYRRTFVAPDGWRGNGRRVFLVFGAADYHTRVWVNGQSVGEHEGGYTPFEFDITEALREGENVLVVRVYDPQDHARQPVGKQFNWYTRTSGIWQTVYLEPRGRAHIKQAHIMPDVDADAARFDVRVSGECEGASIEVELTGSDGEKLTAVLPVDGGAINMRDPKLWEPDAPNLYDVRLTLKQGDAALDIVHTYFGMRKVETKKLPGADCEYVWLNGRPIYLLGALNQSFNPWGVYTFPRDEMIRRDIQRAKDFGWNFLRMHIKIDEPRLLYWADRLGVLLMCDMPNWGSDGLCELAKDRWTRMTHAAIARDFNHPCVFAWCLFNETWGLGGNNYKQNRELQLWVAEKVREVKRLDPTRLVEDNSPCLYDHVLTDINSWHFYINDYDKARDHIRHVVESTFPGSEFNCVPNERQGTAPLLNSEYGGINAGAGDKDISWCFRFLTNELRLHEKICGYVYTEHMDIEWEHNGFMNYDRTVKEFGYDVAALNSPDFVAIDHRPDKVCAPGERFAAPIFTSHFSRKQVGAVRLRWRLDGLLPTGETKRLLEGEQPIDFPQYRVARAAELEFDAPNEPCVATLSVHVVDDGGATVASNSLAFHVSRGDEPPVERVDEKTWLLRFHPAMYTTAMWNKIGPDETSGNGAQEMTSGADAGFFEYSVALPPEVAIEQITRLELTFEASSNRLAMPQTDEHKHPSDLTVSINGIVVGHVRLENQPCDARGALGYIHGLSGQYGFLTTLVAEDERLRKIRLRTEGRGLSVRFAVSEKAEHAGGLVLYGSRAGRYPTGPMMRVS